MEASFRCTGEKVTKAHLQGAVERAWEKRSQLAEVSQPQEQAEKETVSENTDFLGREEAIADSTLVNDLDELVRRVREKRYDKIQDQCRTVRILDVEQEIGIDDIYIDVNVLEEIPSYKHKGLSELLKDLKPDEIDRFSYGRHQERLPGLEAVEKHRKLMVLGQPGAGKTTFLQHIAIEYNQRGFQVNCIPIFILLREFTENAKIEKDFSLFSYISHEFGCCRISAPDQTLTMLLNDGRVLILLDGLDEVPEQDREEVLGQIRKFVRDYCSNRFIITCRIAEGQCRFKNFTNVEIADFTTTQIEKFAQKWFLSLAKKSNREEQEGFQKATQLMKKLKENERILELAATPLLLTLICLVFQPGDDLPAKRSELYEKGMNILLDKWDKDRDIKRDEFYRSLSPYHKIKLLSHVARATFEQPPYYLFEKHIVQRYIADYLGTLPNANPNREELFHDSEAVLQAIGVQHGLLIARSQEIYSFSHRTFQEYFTAKWFVDRADWQGLVCHLTEPHWREVFLLAVGIVNSADELLRQIKKGVDGIAARNDSLQELLTQVSRKSKSVIANYKSAAIRAFYFDLAFIRIAHSDSINESLEPNWFYLAGSDFFTVIGLGFDLAPILDRNLTICFDFGFISHDPSQSAFGDVCSLTDLTIDSDITLDLALYTVWVIGYSFAIDYAIRSTCDDLVKASFALVQALTLTLEINRDHKLGKALEQLQQQLFDKDQSRKQLRNWYRTKGKIWAEELKDLMIQYRRIGYDWQFGNQQKELLRQYYDANQLLMDCLNSDCKVSNEVRSHIEETLLLPIAEIREIEKQRGIK